MKKNHYIYIITAIFLLFAGNMFAKSNSQVIEVKYYHATLRCASCIQIEDFISKTINLAFDKELKDSTLRFTTLDFMQPENEPMMEKYGFDTQALIITKVIDGKEVKFKNLDLIWDYLSDFAKFEKYVEDEIREFSK